MKYALQAAWLTCVLVAATHVTSLAASVGYRLPSDSSAMMVPHPDRAPFLAATNAGARVVAVGLRGVVVFSDDAGKTWTQSKVPVEADLVAVSFPTPTQGWAVGHGGVVLKSSDGGATWVKQFSGQQLNELVVRHYESQNPPALSLAAMALKQAGDSIQSKTTPSLLDVWFDTPSTGTMVGAFNTIFRTEDAGKTWTPWMDRMDNPGELHFYAVRGNKNDLYLTGEKGTVWRLDQTGQRFEALATGYSGTLFGLVVDESSLLAFGMRGSVFRSEDAGKSWTPVSTPRKIGITGGRRLINGDIVLVDQAGGILRSKDHGRTFSALDANTRMPLFGIAQLTGGQLFTVGAMGVRVESIH